MSTIVLETPQDQDVPFTYVLSGAQTFRPESAFAHWDGTGASGPFLACLTFRAQDGKIFSRTFPSTPIAAGGEADVSYAPFPGGIGQPAPPSGVVLDEAIFSDTVTLTGSGGAGAITVAWAPVGSQTLWNLTNPQNPEITRAGLLIVSLSVQCFLASPPPVGAELEPQLLIPGPAGSFPGTMNFAPRVEATVALPAPAIFGAYAGMIAAGDPATLVITITDGAPIDVFYELRTNLVEG